MGISLARRSLVAMGTLAVLAVAVATAACGGEAGPDGNGSSTGSPTGPAVSPPPASETLTPTPEAGSAEGFEAMLGTFNREISRGALDPIIARMLTRPYTCRAADLEAGAGRPECSSAGQTIDAIEIGNWRSEGGLRQASTAVALIQSLQREVAVDATDRWGDGAPTVYAFDGVAHRAVVTTIVKCLPEFRCPEGTMRIAMVLTFTFRDSRWYVTRILNALVLAEEFLEPSPEVTQGQMPNWERIQ